MYSSCSLRENYFYLVNFWSLSAWHRRPTTILSAADRQMVLMTVNGGWSAFAMSHSSCGFPVTDKHFPTTDLMTLVGLWELWFHFHIHRQKHSGVNLIRFFLQWLSTVGAVQAKLLHFQIDVAHYYTVITQCNSNYLDHSKEKSHKPKYTSCAGQSRQWCYSLKCHWQYIATLQQLKNMNPCPHVSLTNHPASSYPWQLTGITSRTTSRYYIQYSSTTHFFFFFL